MEIENLSKIMYFMYFLYCIFSSKSIFSVLVKLRSQLLSITIWLTFVLYSNIFQLYIELKGLALREVQYVITSNFPT